MAKKRNVETERKFIVSGPLDELEAHLASNPAAWEMRQGYLALPHQPGESEIRLRWARAIEYPVDTDGGKHKPLTGENATLVIRLGAKRDIATDGSGGLSRNEEEIDLDEADFNRLWLLTEGRRLRKTRVEYLVDLPAGPRVITVDTFSGHLSGLRLAEIEFDTWDASREFEAPGFLGEDVTHDPRYRNAALALADTVPLNDASTPDADL